MQNGKHKKLRNFGFRSWEFFFFYYFNIGLNLDSGETMYQYPDLPSVKQKETSRNVISASFSDHPRSNWLRNRSHSRSSKKFLWLRLKKNGWRNVRMLECCMLYWKQIRIPTQHSWKANRETYMQNSYRQFDGYPQQKDVRYVSTTPLPGVLDTTIHQRSPPYLHMMVM